MTKDKKNPPEPKKQETSVKREYKVNEHKSVSRKIRDFDEKK